MHWHISGKDNEILILCFTVRDYIVYTWWFQWYKRIALGSLFDRNRSKGTSWKSYHSLEGWKGNGSWQRHLWGTLRSTEGPGVVWCGGCYMCLRTQDVCTARDHTKINLTMVSFCLCCSWFIQINGPLEGEIPFLWLSKSLINILEGFKLSTCFSPALLKRWGHCFIVTYIPNISQNSWI